MASTAPQTKEGPTVSVKSADMTEEMQQFVIGTTKDAIITNELKIEKEIAEYIKKTMDKHKGATWHCIVGRNFGSFVTHETKHFIYFYFDHFAILLFKTA
ncbi:MAG: Dynein light chain [Vezdaea acicularis]|nr:MAG: Dynein light chain [Vezdaea acicularis]